MCCHNLEVIRGFIILKSNFSQFPRKFYNKNINNNKTVDRKKSYLHIKLCNIKILFIAFFISIKVIIHNLIILIS